MSAPRRVQLQLRIPYKDQPTRHRAIRERLEAGWKIEEYLRISDGEVVVTLVEGVPEPAAG